jgi:hypothetical protein
MALRIAVANRDFSVALVHEGSKVLKPYQVDNGEDLKILSCRIMGVTRSGDRASSETKVVCGYLVEIEGQTVFIDESLLEVSK